MIDDGSTDGSLDAIKSFGDRIRWETGPNRGGSAARNRGVKLARGEIIQFLDADDLLYPEKLERQVPPMLEGRADIVCCDWESAPFEEPKDVKQHMLNYENGRTDPVVFCLGSQLPTPSPLHWKVNLEEVGGFDETLPCSQEADLHLRLACMGLSFFHLPEILYKVRATPNSVSSNYIRVLEQHNKIIQRAADLLQDRDALTDSRREALAFALARDGRRYVQRGRSDAAGRFFRLARNIHPSGGVSAFSPYLRLIAGLSPCFAERLSMLRRRVTRFLRKT